MVASFEEVQQTYLVEKRGLGGQILPFVGVAAVVVAAAVAAVAAVAVVGVAAVAVAGIVEQQGPWESAVDQNSWRSNQKPP